MKKALVLMTLVTLCLTGCAGHKAEQPAKGPSTTDIPDTKETVSSTLTIDIPKIGKADCSIITVGDETLMIDTGEDQDADKIISYLNEKHIDTIDYLIITHYDKDHVGGADKIIDAFTVKEVFDPGYAKESTDYTEYVEALSDKNITPTVLAVPHSFQMADAALTIYPPEKASYEEGDNDFSLITTLNHGSNSFLFAGDAEAERLKEAMSSIPLGQTFLKVPHHGRFNSESEAFFKAVSPQYAVITCSKKKPASDKVLAVLNDIDTQTYLTSEGDIHVESDGKSLAVTQKDLIR